MKQPQKTVEVPNEVQHAQSICQHASSILSDMIKVRAIESVLDIVQVVEASFKIADVFDAELQKRMSASIEASGLLKPEIVKP